MMKLIRDREAQMEALMVGKSVTQLNYPARLRRFAIESAANSAGQSQSELEALERILLLPTGEKEREFVQLVLTMKPKRSLVRRAA
jgi:hypothetical protein